MRAIRLWFKKYCLVTLATVIVALFTGLPSLVFFQRVGDGFRGVYPVFNGDALYYQARVREIGDGHPTLNHQYFFEHKDATYPQATGAEYFVYGLSKLFGVSAPALQIVFDFLLPAIIFLLTYLLFKKISSNEYTAVFLPILLYTVVMGGLFKPLHPQATLPLLLLFLIFWARLIISQEKKWFNSVMAGIFWGLLFLSYFYHWSFLAVVVGIYILILLLSKSFAELKYHGVMIGIAGFIGIPYWLRIFDGLNAPFHAETAVRVGMYFSHLPESYPRLAVALVWLVFFVWFAGRYRNEQEKKTQIAATLLIANVLYPNHQLITGIILNNASHWSWMPILIFAFSAHYAIDVLKRENMQAWKNRLMAVAVVILLILPAWRLSTFLWHYYPDQYGKNITEDRQYYADVFSWIEANAKKDDVIFSDMELMSFIPVYTSANVYNSYYGFVLPGSDAEVIERTLLSRFFEPDFFIGNSFGLDDEARILWSFPGDAEKNTHTIAGRWVIPYEPQYSLEKERAKVAEVYNNFVKSGWDVSLLKKYRLDYIIWDKKEKPGWNLEQYKELELVEGLGNVLVYRLRE